jgi:hypothetical protein
MKWYFEYNKWIKVIPRDAYTYLHYRFFDGKGKVIHTYKTKSGLSAAFFILANMKTYTVAEALDKLRNYCAFQERCHKDVKDKLRTMGMISQATDQIIGTLGL